MSKSGKEPNSTRDEVELIVTKADYEAGSKRGWIDDEMLKPDRYN